MCLILCDQETSIMMWPRLQLGCCAAENKNSWKEGRKVGRQFSSGAKAAETRK